MGGGDTLREIGDALADAWPYVLSVSMFLLAIGSSIHAILTKKEPRAAFTWVGMIWLVPGIGFALYALFGINRIRRRAQALRPETQRRQALALPHACTPAEAASATGRPALASLARLVDKATPERLLGGNRVELLENGDRAFPAMLAAIDAAERSLTLCTYIFDHDESGKAFAAALERARERGVEVRVLIDDVGARYSFPPIVWHLARAGIPVARFLPTATPFRFPYINLRNHRKTLVVDGRIGFTGGMNIRAGNVLARSPKHPIQDLHARLDGPVVGHLQAAFAEDWLFARKERLSGEQWFPALSAAGPVLARGLLEGPDRPIEPIIMTLLGALAAAERRVRVVTPYFVPPEALSTALGVAAMRGVEVDILVPAHNNLILVHWASMSAVRELLERGCRVWLTPPPFDHTKLMVVDDAWTLFGSANWDTRSLRLNFELCVEAYDTNLAAEAEAIVARKLAASAPLTLDAVNRRGLAERLRNSVAHMFAPYL